jgi:brefeldin A-inhibited guanine nucleotide-exchange protein
MIFSIGNFLENSWEVKGKFFSKKRSDKSSELSSKLLHAIVNRVDFGGVSIDEALRKFLKAFTLPRKAQKFIHIMRVWSARYFALNSESYFTSLGIFIQKKKNSIL